MVLAALGSVCQTHAVANFPIATNADIIEFTGGIASSGSNYLAGFFQNQTNPCVQLVSTNGSLIGPVLTIGESEGSTLVAASKSNYLAFWASDNDSNGVDVSGHQRRRHRQEPVKVTPDAADKQTGEILGIRVAEFTLKLKK